jgi:hypothetical protein
MNFTHWWRAYRNRNNRSRYPSVAPGRFGISPLRSGRLAVVERRASLGSSQADA